MLDPVVYLAFVEERRAIASCREYHSSSEMYAIGAGVAEDHSSAGQLAMSKAKAVILRPKPL